MPQGIRIIFLGRA